MQIKSRFLWARLLPKSIVLNIATLGGIGNRGFMPGTLGSILGFFLYALVFHYLNPFFYSILMLILAYFAAGISDAAEKHLMQKDPGSIILDEFVAIPFVFFGLNAYNPNVLELNAWPIYLVGFFLFRFFDILKPFGISQLERVEGGIGCVVDDLVSAIVSCLLLHAYVFSQMPSS